MGLQRQIGNSNGIKSMALFGETVGTRKHILGGQKRLHVTSFPLLMEQILFQTKFGLFCRWNCVTRLHRCRQPCVCVRVCGSDGRFCVVLLQICVLGLVLRSRV